MVYKRDWRNTHKDVPHTFESTDSGVYAKNDYYIAKVKEISYFGEYWNFTIDIFQEQKVTVRKDLFMKRMVDFVDSEIGSDYPWLK